MPLRTTDSLNQLDLKTPYSPLQTITSTLLDDADVRLSIKRDDLIDPGISGNKWRKLKYNLLEANKHNHQTLLTFGGAWSNHIQATAAAGRRFGIKTIGIIRGEKPDTLSSTLEYATRCGMHLHFISREQYRLKENKDFLTSLRNKFGEFYLIPEGGKNALARRGCREIIDEINTQLDQPFTDICCACGTGTTLTGLIENLSENQKATGFAVLKGAEFLEYDVLKQLDEDRLPQKSKQSWQIEQAYHFGGYAKYNNDLIDFIKQFYTETGIPLDAVYTGKLFYGLLDRIRKGYYRKGSHIVALHTGGLQGNAGIPELATILPLPL